LQKRDALLTVKESCSFELACLSFFTQVGMLFIMKKPKDEKYIVIKAYKFTALEISLYHHILRVSAIPTYRAY